jgi:hypothetical protein
MYRKYAYEGKHSDLGATHHHAAATAAPMFAQMFPHLLSLRYLLHFQHFLQKLSAFNCLRAKQHIDYIVGYPIERRLFGASEISVWPTLALIHHNQLSQASIFARNVTPYVSAVVIVELSCATSLHG